MAKKGAPQFIGARVRRREDPDLVIGAGKYVADLDQSEALHMAFVRSPYAHAKVLAVDGSPALAMNGVTSVFTAEDINKALEAPLPVLTDSDGGRFESLCPIERYPLASSRVRHVGDPVAVVVAEDPYVLADAVEAVSVDYEPLPVVAEPAAALAEGAPRLHEGCPDNRAFVWTVEGGRVDEAFAGASHVVELEARIQRLIPNAMEPRAVLAAYDDEKGYTLWSTTQFPHMLRDFLATILGIERKRLRVVAPEVGGGFGAKCNVYGEEVLAVALARRLERPVRWTASRSEDYLATSHGRDQKAVLRLAADDGGRVQAIELTLTMDIGAYYSRVTPIIPALTGLMIPGVYDVENVRATATGILTNKVVSEPYRGAGRPEAAYLIERGMDVLARELELDPAELRRRNFVPPEAFPYETATGLIYDSGNYPRALAEALKRVGYLKLRREQKERRRNQDEKLLGIGLSCYVEICGFGPWELGTVRVGPDAGVTVLTGTSPHGQGHETSWAQIAADVLQIPPERIEVVHGDTGIVPKGIGTFGSRSAPVGGAAVYQSSEKVREGAKQIAAHLLEAAPADIRLANGKFHVVGLKSRNVSWEEVAAAAHGDEIPAELRAGLTFRKQFRPPGETYPFGVHVCVVEIDSEIGEIAIRRFLTVDDCGRVINPLLVEGQVHGGIAQGIGQALWEGAFYDEDGNLLTGSLMEYAIARAETLPRFETNRTETPTPINPLGVKGIGEAATIGSTPAVVNAVVDALAPLGVQHVDTPLTPEKIWRLLHLRQQG